MNQAVVLVVSPVAAEMAGLAQAELRPGLAEIALALARNVLDNPRAAFEPRGGRGEAGRHCGQAASGGCGSAPAIFAYRWKRLAKTTLQSRCVSRV